MSLPVCVPSDGNAFSIVGAASKVLKRAGLEDQAKEMSSRALSSNSYDELIQIVMEYVDLLPSDVEDDEEDESNEDD